MPKGHLVKRGNSDVHYLTHNPRSIGIPLATANSLQLRCLRCPTRHSA